MFILSAPVLGERNAFSALSFSLIAFQPVDVCTCCLSPFPHLARLQTSINQCEWGAGTISAPATAADDHALLPSWESVLCIFKNRHQRGSCHLHFWISHRPRTSLVIHSSWNNGAAPVSFCFASNIYLCGHFLFPHIPVRSVFPSTASLSLSWNLIIPRDNFHIPPSCLRRIFVPFHGTISDVPPDDVMYLFLHLFWGGKLISVCRVCVSEQHIPESIIVTQWPFLWEKKAIIGSFTVAFIANRFVTWRSMEVSAAGQDGLLVAITTAAARGPVCAGHGPVIAPPLSAVARDVTASASRSPTAPGKYLLAMH